MAAVDGFFEHSYAMMADIWQPIRLVVCGLIVLVAGAVDAPEGGVSVEPLDSFNWRPREALWSILFSRQSQVAINATIPIGQLRGERRLAAEAECKYDPGCDAYGGIYYDITGGKSCFWECGKYCKMGAYTDQNCKCSCQLSSGKTSTRTTTTVTTIVITTTWTTTLPDTVPSDAHNLAVINNALNAGNPSSSNSGYAYTNNAPASGVDSSDGDTDDAEDTIPIIVGSVVGVCVLLMCVACCVTAVAIERHGFGDEMYHETGSHRNNHGLAYMVHKVSSRVSARMSGRHSLREAETDALRKIGAESDPPASVKPSNALAAPAPTVATARVSPRVSPRDPAVSQRPGNPKKQGTYPQLNVPEQKTSPRQGPSASPRTASPAASPRGGDGQRVRNAAPQAPRLQLG